MSGMKKAIGGSIHRIREFELEKVNLIDEFDILQIVGEGWFGKILLTEHRSTQTEMVLKALPKAYTGISDFFREFHYGLHLSAHRNIITTYDVAFETAGFYVFSQEYAPLGDLTSNVTETGLGELHAKRVARQLAAAVHHIHSRELVHRDIKLDNILVFRSDFSRIKLCDFGETRRVNTVVRRHNEWLPYSPPEVLQIDTDETYKARTSHDVWQFGIVLFVCLTGCLPWQKAAMDDPRYTRYQNWHNATLNIAKKPKLFQLISSRAQRMFKRLLDPKIDKRPVSVLEVNKYLEDRWLAKLGVEKALNGGADERDELCPSMYSFHSSLEEKNQLLHTLTTYGIETTVDHSKKKDRIREWIQASAIVEENEEDESDVYEDSEFCEDEDKDNDGNGSEETESISMRGRHFPERRPSATTNNSRKRRDSRVAKNRITSKNRVPVKPIERKIPFAPQVAEERETIARFASFPNGDPNLAAVRNGGDQTHDLSATSVNVLASPTTNNFSAGNLQSSVPSANGRNVKDQTRTNANNSRDESPLSVQLIAAVPVKQSPPKTTGIPDSAGRVVPMSPQIPARKNRAHTAPFSETRSAEAQTDLARKTESATVLRTSETEDSLPPRVSAKTSVSSHPMTTRVDNPSVAILSTSRAARSIAPPIVRTDRAPAAPIISNASLAEPQPSNSALPGRVEGSPPIATHITTSATSRLAVQSFNALQGIAGASSTASPASSSSNMSKPGQRAEEVNVAYGKDAYQHYGIAQGIILPMKINVIRQNSTGSGSRSVSN
ncbi:PREDICTED: putative serine/threonine-protein kinase YPL150W [Trachymyrmex cornetzi]|uniref:putative serine/threonine-protein kinase YPL150W n=1 Tax=Trachymyrmex cornetzi TaxID=471704 RepID=UPI00084F473A|nr:PREDICTED: putative serine/threonine-protein kinase YPL150W [Trachymyrmex cornetzi]XP_018362794.1 PREDICTED: putative serine/threonine-protein kinase YPL150W [Trachymyrmex cornetzi]XP_018362795.1 PREDICTED: putative serine/threonine-protein kinase YPL150W [Trachymyrmex cornetzi]